MKKIKTPIKAVLFDMGNVLLNYNAHQSARQFAKECKIPMIKVWLHFFVSPVEKAYTRGEISTYEFYRYAKNGLKLDIDYKAFRHYWSDIFRENKGMDGLLRKLKKKYPLYLISNTNAMHFNHIKKKFKILRHFRRTFPSHEVGHRKPSPEIYLKVLKKIRLQPAETVFIDDVPKFVRGARRVGMHAIRFTTKSSLVKDLRKLGVKI